MATMQMITHPFTFHGSNLRRDDQWKKRAALPIWDLMRRDKLDWFCHLRGVCCAAYLRPTCRSCHLCLARPQQSLLISPHPPSCAPVTHNVGEIINTPCIHQPLLSEWRNRQNATHYRCCLHISSALNEETKTTCFCHTLDEECRYQQNCANEGHT